MITSNSYNVPLKTVGTPDVQAKLIKFKYMHAQPSANLLQ